MGWIKNNGISVLIADNADVGDYLGRVGQATADMIQWRETWGNDEEFCVKRCGDHYTLHRLNGEDYVVMGPVPRPKIPSPKMPAIENIPFANFVPAFHACDPEGTVVGLVICLSGVWGPPYKFIPCEEGDLLDFDWGWWNYHAGAERPSEDDNKETLVFSWYIPDEMTEEIWDIPAAHEYITDDTLKGYDGATNYQWSGSHWIVSVLCGKTEAHLYNRRAGTAPGWQTWDYAIIVWEDHSGGGEDQPSIFGVQRNMTEAHYFESHGGSTSCWNPDGDPDCCNIAQGNVANLDNDWDSQLSSVTQRLVIEKQFQYSGAYPSNIMGTAMGTTGEEAFFYYGRTDYGSGYFTNKYYVIQLSGFPNRQFASESSGDIGSDTCSEYCVWLGEEYLLAEGDVAYHEYDDNILTCNPRMYQLSENSDYIGLSSYYRESKDYWYYNCFRPKKEAQVGEDSFKCTYVDRDLHKIDGLTISANGQQFEAHGNGEFSLVRIDNFPFDRIWDE